MSLLRRGRRRGPLGRTVGLARMAGTSIAAPDAAPWVTDFLNAAYYARPRDERSVDDLRLAWAVLTTRWHRAGRRLHLSDLAAFHSAFGRARLGRRGGLGRLARADLLAGAAELLGDGFPEGYADDRRRGWGIVFRDPAERDAYRPESRLEHGALRELTPPGDPAALHWSTYAPVPVGDVGRVAARLLAPDTWPDYGSDHGRFTAVRPGGLLGQTFEIEVVAGAGTRRPVITRGYVTATRVTGPDDPAARRALVEELDAGLALRGAGHAVPEGQEAVLVAELTTHRGHFMGPARSHLVLVSGPGGGSLRDVGAWDPLTFPQSTAYRWGGAAAQHAFWGEAAAESSMLHQFAAT